MGIYLNPTDQTKEQFLAEHGRPISEIVFRNFTVPDDECYVCLVDNGPFTAAAVAYDRGEMEAFSDPSDPRPRLYVAVPIEAVAKILSETELRVIKS